MYKTILVILIAILVAVPSFAQTLPRSCTVAGVWYGGSVNAKYMLAIVEDPGGNYTMAGLPGFSLATWGFPVLSDFWSVLLKVPGDHVEFFGTGLLNSSTNFPAPNAELWAVHGTGYLTACDSLQLDYDFFGAYFIPTDKVPFTSPPDYVVVPPPFSETYTRVPTKCTQCGNQ